MATDKTPKLIVDNTRTTQPVQATQTMQATGTQQMQTTQAPQQPALGSHITNQLDSRNQQRVNVSTPQGIGQNTMQEIRRKAEAGIALDAPTAEKMQAYEQFQQRSAQLIAEAARTGQRLHDPNDWKQSIYDEALKGLNANDLAYYNSDNVMSRQEREAQERMSAMEEFLTGSRDGYMKSQEALLGKARDEQIAALQKALEDAVTEGQISVREAEAAFEENKATIEQQAYLDAERTRGSASERGISNSMQMLGLQAGDDARNRSMINKNMTDRDMRINNIKDRVNAIKNKTSIDLSTANANHDYGIAGAQGQADMQFNTQMFDMMNQDHMLTRQQQFQLDQQGMGQQFQRNLAYLQQQYTLEQFAVQQGYNLQNMDVSQRYQLQQMYQSHTYNMAMQNNAQGWQSGENMLDRGHQAGMQENAQNWQSGENNLDRGHQANMQAKQQAWQAGQNTEDRQLQRELLNTQITAQQQAASNVVDEYNLALQRELNKYTPGTPEYELTQQQVQQATEAMKQEMKTKTGLEITAKQLVDGGIPTNPGSKPKAPDKNWFQSIQSSMAKKFPTLSGIAGMDSKKLEDARLKAYNEEVKLWEQQKAVWDNYNEYMK